MKISICMISWNRAEIMKKVLKHNHSQIILSEGLEIEYLFADQGSSDKSVNVLKKWNPSYLRLNTKNEGVAQTFNQLMIRATGNYVVLMGNDILMPKDWLGEMIRYAEHFKKECGLIGVKCTTVMPPLSTRNGVHAHFVDEKIDKVFGTWLMPRHLFNSIGYFDENYKGYGLEDSDYNNRVNRAGFISFYVPDKNSEHLAHDVGDKSKYRRDKDSFLKHNCDYHNQKWGQKKVELYYSTSPKDPI